MSVEDCLHDVVVLTDDRRFTYQTIDQAEFTCVKCKKKGFFNEGFEYEKDGWFRAFFERDDGLGVRLKSWKIYDLYVRGGVE